MDNLDSKIKTGYIIESASGWYWSGFMDKNRQRNHLPYTIFDSEEEAISFLPNALDGNMEAKSIKKVYYHG